MKVKIESLKAEINLNSDKLKHFEELKVSLQEDSRNLTKTIESKEKQINDLNKANKKELKLLIEELKNIKEKWINIDQYNELISIKEDLEIKLKLSKEDLSRKREIISSLKTSNLELKAIKDKNLNDNTLNSNINNNNNNNNIDLNEKIKSLSKELTKKDLALKDLKNNYETLKLNDVKLKEENLNLNEKLKISKIDISRKESIIKDLKDKTENLNVSQLSLSKQDDLLNLKENCKKLKGEIDRKDTFIKGLKTKLEVSSLEIEQLKDKNLNLNKFHLIKKEEKEEEDYLKLKTAKKQKLQNYLYLNEELKSILRRIFKDLIFNFEKMKNLKSEKEIYNFKEGLSILNLKENELEDFINPSLISSSPSLCNNNFTKNKFSDHLTEKVNKMLENENIDSESLMKIYNNIIKKLIISNNTDTFKETTLDNNNNNELNLNFNQKKNSTIKKYENFLNEMKSI